MKKIVLVDGHNLLFRMFYGIPASIKNSKGKEIKGLVGFIGSIKKLIKEFKPYSLIVVFDSETSKNENLKISQEYKANRIDYSKVLEENNHFSNLPLIKNALEYLEIKYIEVENYEADDFIASIVTNKKCNGDQYIIISTDTDFIQLVNRNTFLYVPRGKNSILYDEKEVLKKYKISPKKYPIFKSLVGDKSDNIKGISGIGNITASKILKYGTINDYIINNPTSKYSKILLNNKNIIEKNLRLITMNNNLNVSKVFFKEVSKNLTKYKTYEIINKIVKS